jgi:predicted nucleic acid-binding protein
MPDRPVICNTSPLLYLHQVGQLGLLRDLYGRVLIPSAVREELRAGGERGCSVPDVDKMEWLHVRTPPETSLIPMVIDLGAGETEAIALALAEPGSLLILDDSLGRRIAHLNGLTLTGTLGVLIKAKKEGLLSEVSPVVDALRQTTMHLTPTLIEAVLKDAGEI